MIRKILMVTEGQMDALLVGRSIESTPLPVRDRSDEVYIGAKSPMRSCEVTSEPTSASTFRLTMV